MMSSISLFLGEGANILWFMIVLPAAFGVVAWLLRKSCIPKLLVVTISSVLNLLFALSLYCSEGFYRIFPFMPGDMDMAFNIYEFSSLFLVFTAVIFLLVSLYSVVFLRNEDYAGRFMLYLHISLAMINGALMSDNLGVMLFFWEGLLCTLFGILLINNMQNPKTAIKALVLSGTADLLLMLGITITVFKTGTPFISHMSKLPISGISGIGFLCMLLGAVGKAGCMPFHSWIPNAAEDAPTPFLAAFPGSLGNLLGMYLAARIVTDIYGLLPGSIMSTAVMLLGMFTIIFAASMSLIQNDIKRMLSYQTISQVGYMVLGIGTALPAGVIGGLFHMLNHAIYKSCMFMTAGSIERQAGTTDLGKISGLAKNLPVTTACFITSGLAIAGVPPLNGFFSKELVFNAALESNVLFYAGALLGAFLTAVSFLKLGRAAFAGKLQLGPDKQSVRESSIGMLLPMGVLAVLCVLFGVANEWALDGLLGPALGIEETYSGWTHSTVLAVISVIVLILAVWDHIYGSRKSGSALNAADHIRYAAGLKSIYTAAEKGWFDPYNLIMHAVSGFSAVCDYIERGVAWFYDVGTVNMVNGATDLLHRLNNGSLARYLVFAFAGVACIAVIFLAVLL